MHALCFALGLVFAANGLWMLGLPAHWYTHLPNVAASGAFNAHFARDIGAAYSLCGVAFLAFAVQPGVRPYARAACAFLLAHGAIHVAEALFGEHGIGDVLRDAPGVLLLPLAASWAAWR